MTKLWLTFLVAWVAVAVVLGRSGSSPVPFVDGFPHSKHVRDAWYTGPSDAPASAELWRDCRGCHLASDPGLLRVPGEPALFGAEHVDAQCARCHLSAGDYSLTAEPAANRPTGELGAIPIERVPNLVFGERIERAFPHGDHIQLACRECHSVSLSGDGEPRISPSIADCAACHEAGARTEPFDWLADTQAPQDLEARLGEAFRRHLDEQFRRPDYTGRTFLHADHLAAVSATPAAGGEEGSCVDCHGVLFESAQAPDLSGGHLETVDGALSGPACATCHRGESPSSVPFTAASVASTSRSWLTFDHAVHLQPREGANSATPASRDALATQGCAVCHQAGGESLPGDDFGFALAAGVDSDLEPSSYAGCRSCHDSPAWDAGPHGQWAREGADRDRDRADCAQCHAFGDPIHGMVANRPVASVPRLGGIRFTAGGNAHPHVTGTLEQRTEDCAKCHRAQAGLVDSKLLGSRFLHSTHLADDLSPAELEQQCNVCHPRLETRASAGELGYPLASNVSPGLQRQLQDAGWSEARLSFDMEACATCHRGDGLRIESLVQPLTEEPRSTVEFDHAFHLKSERADAPGCVDCHPVEVALPQLEVGFSEGVASCNSCHDHGTEDPATGTPGRMEVESCNYCHQAHLNEARDALAEDWNAPAGNTARRVIPLPRSELAGILAFSQRVSPDGRSPMVHPASPGCLECHRRSEIESPAEVLGSTLFAGKVENLSSAPFHPNGAIPSRAGVVGAGAFLQEQCCQCHWNLKPQQATVDCLSVGAFLGAEPDDGPSAFPGVSAAEALGQ